MQLEIGQLDRKYAPLRTLAEPQLGSLMASLASLGQQSPALVVQPDVALAPVLIDGYRRAAALAKLGQDTIEAVRLELAEADALVLRHRMAASNGTSALEDGWLLRELTDRHGLSQRELSQRLSRSVSWVSRRLGLIENLPDKAQQLVRDGKVAPQAAMKHLLPLSRANRAAVERLAEAMAGRSWSVREVMALVRGWRAALPEKRPQIEANPELFCRAAEEFARELPVLDADGHALVKALHELAGHHHRLRRQFQARLRQHGALQPADGLAASCNEVDRAWSALREIIHNGVGHAR